MGSIERIMLAVVGVAMATTLVLPGRQTPAIATSVLNGFSGLIRTSTGR